MMKETSLTIRQAFSKALLYTMNQHGISSEELAEKLGINKQTIDKWLSAKSFPLKNKIKALEDYFGVDINIYDNSIRFIEKQDRDDIVLETRDVRDIKIDKEEKEKRLKKLEKELPQNCFCFPSVEEVAKKPFIALIAAGTKPEEVEEIMRKLSDYVRAV